MKNLNVIVLIFWVHLSFSARLNAQDPKLESQFKQIGIDYSYDQNGNRYKFIFDVGDGRTQLVLMNANTYDVAGTKIREIYSVAANTQNRTDYSQRTLFNLLEKNFNYKIGGWQMHGGEPPYQLQFAIRIPAYVDDDYLLELLIQAAREADQIEKELTCEDEF
ncbi:hypothetical protein AT05_06830 [Schleiferia thermophila str. Yellowstone]|uniref:hypothetical protein n=1 Tax=Schleiferia thermophila TaxID=884107 RepID=UPI0004E71AA7|nr:hypothetical protein [Schleiferia thermophila]KFD39083.1 hypothetical protein AT05_06830 [Schleiferia thermophila str. Yellowstone]